MVATQGQEDYSASAVRMDQLKYGWNGLTNGLTSLVYGEGDKTEESTKNDN